MILYRSGGLYHIVNLFQLNGSVFRFAFSWAFPNAVIAGACKLAIRSGYMKWLDWDEDHQILLNNAPWNGFTFLVGFLIVFRTSQSYARYWDSCTATTEARSQWYDAASALVAFTRHSQAPEDEKMAFKHLIIRLFSMLHASALKELTEGAGTCEEPLIVNLIDPGGLDPAAFHIWETSQCRIAMTFQWIQAIIVDNIRTNILSIPPPILSRVFQQLGNGMICFHQALQISEIPIPFPYTQVCDYLLIMHWLTTPFIIQTWTSSPWWAMTFSFVMVFVYWSLNAIAVEIEKPFTLGANDLDFAMMQDDLNKRLITLLMPCSNEPPTLSPKVSLICSDDFTLMHTELCKNYNFDSCSGVSSHTTEIFRTMSPQITGQGRRRASNHSAGGDILVQEGSGGQQSDASRISQGGRVQTI